MEKFECHIDLTNINDSMELDSGQEIASYEKDGYAITLEVQGSVRVIYDHNTYRCASKMPKDLIELFHDGMAYRNEDVYIDMNNWFEIFVWEIKDKGYEWTGYSDVVDAENMSPEETKAFLKDCLDDYLNDN